MSNFLLRATLTLPAASRLFRALTVGAAILSTTTVLADTEYYRHTFFDNSITSDSYYYSSGKAVVPSILKLRDGKLPVDSSTFVTPPNSLRLAWQSLAGGSWQAEITVVDFRNREVLFRGDTLSFWCYSAEALPAAKLPQLRFLDAHHNFSAPLRIGDFSSDLPAGKWMRVQIPLQRIKTDSLHKLDPHRLERLVFGQGVADGTEHALLLDEFRIDDAAIDAGTPIPLAPQNLQARGYELHVDLSWDSVSGSELARYIIYRSDDAKQFRPVGIQEPGINRYTDFLGKTNLTVYYQVTASGRDYRESPSSVVNSSTRPFTDDELLTMLQEACFRYYWEGAQPDSGLARENIPGEDRLVATGASGFGIMALVAGVERGFITREQGVQRLTKIVDFLEKAPRYHGAWSHFIDGQTLPVFGIFENGGDIVETAGAPSSRSEGGPVISESVLCHSEPRQGRDKLRGESLFDLLLDEDLRWH